MRLRSPEAGALFDIVEDAHRHSHAQSEAMLAALGNYA
jgi:hypothetical protein